MGTKTKTSKRNPKIIIAICLALALLAAIGVSTFAWIRNYVAVEQMSLTTGKMLYKITLYQKDANGVYTSTELYDTGDGTNPTEIPKNLETQIEAAKQQINVKPGEEVFFVVEKYPDSIDLDVSLAFEKDGTPEQYKYMGQTFFKMKDDSSNFDTKMDAVGGNIDNAISNLANDSGIANSAEKKNMNAIWETVQKTRSLDSEASNACIRLAFTEVTKNQSNDTTDSTFPLNLKFCVSQKGAKEDDSGARIDVASIGELVKAVESYGFNDEIYITGVGSEASPEKFDGDLVFTRPCKIILNRSHIEVNGNLIFSYAYEGEYSLDTISDGHIDVSGNFQIDLPNSKIDLLGANNAAANKADVYVAGKFLANASRLETRGLNFKGMRVCAANETLKPLEIMGDTRLTTANRTQIGKLSVVNYGDDGHKFALEIDNKGSIEQIDLTNMKVNDTLRRTPTIFIDNSGTIVDPIIRLPDWAEKFVVDDVNGTPDDENDDYTGNTRIIANKGSSKMYAVTTNFIGADGVVNWPNTSSDLDKSFISNRDKDYGTRDDIEYAVRDTFIEVLKSDSDGNATSIVIHYEVPSEEAVRNNAALADLVPVGTENIPLSKYLEFYGYMTSKGGVLPITLLNDVKIICYGDKALIGNANNPEAEGYKIADHENDYLTDDYACIRKMENLETLDLSEAMSKSIDITLRDPSINSKADIIETHRTVPEGAFRGMSKLSNVIMSESDTAWGRNLFVDTQVDEITLPQALVRLLNSRYSNPSLSNYGKVNAQDVLTGVKYVYTSITRLKGLWSGDSGTQYFFTYDQQSYDYYRSLSTTAGWLSKIFINNGVVRCGEEKDVFVRYDSLEEDHLCEFVVYTGNSEAWIKNFNFSTISIDGTLYEIVSFDPFAFYNKLDSNITQSISINFGEALKNIGAYAFAANSKIVALDFAGATTLNGHCFYNNTSLKSVDAPLVATLNGGSNFEGNSSLETFNMPKLSTVSNAGDLKGCVSLERADIGVIKRTTANREFYSSTSDVYAKFYIHTDNVGEINYSAALAANNRYIFVDSDYAALYRATSDYTGVAEIGNTKIDELKKIIVEGVEYYYYLLEDSTVCLVACLTERIDKSNAESYTIIDSITDESGTHEISKIGSAAYHFTEIYAKILNLPDSVTEIGQYAFDARLDKFKKRIGTINLQNVLKAGKGAFYAVDMLSVSGDELVEVGASAFSNNKELLLVDLPNLAKGSSVFDNASALRVAYIGFSNNTTYDNKASLENSYIRVLNDLGVTATNKSVSNVNTIVNGNFKFNSFSRNKFITQNNYADVYFSDFYERSQTFEFIEKVNGVNVTKSMTVSVSLPGYVFYKNGDGTLTLFTVSPDIELSSNYTTPEYLYVDEQDMRKNTVVDNGSAVKLRVSKIGVYAYGVVTMGGKVTDLTIGSTVDTIEGNAFRGSALLGNTNNIVLGSTVTRVDLKNVKSIGEYAFRESMFSTLISNNVEYISASAFSICKNLSEVYLPSFKEALGTGIFQGCESLIRVTLGEDTRQLSHEMFAGTSRLQRITILGDEDSIVPILAFPPSESAPVILTSSSAVEVYVHGGIYDEYAEVFSLDFDKNTGSFGGIKPSKIHKYGEKYTDSDTGIIYYWEKIGANSDKAYIDYIEYRGSFESLTIPGSFELNDKTYYVSAVSPSAISALLGVVELTLPSQMEYLTFTAAALPDTVKKLVISADNESFMTDANGVLYSKDGKILYAYPKAREADSFTVNSVVEQIFDEAFYGAKRLKTITIAGSVVINDRAFDNAFSLVTVDFTSATASMFAGSDIFGGIYSEGFKITVPGASLEAYKENVLIDYSIVDKIKAR